MIFVAGPPGGGKSSALSIKQLGIDWFNADDRAAQLNSGYHKISLAIREMVGLELEGFILNHITARRDLAFETTLRSAITFEQTRLAHANGFHITIVYVAAGSVEEHIRRVANRADLGQHSASEAKIRDIYEKNMGNLLTAFQEHAQRRIEFVRIFDNSRLWQPPRVTLEMRGGEVHYLDDSVPEWLETALKGSDFNIPAIRKARLFLSAPSCSPGFRSSPKRRSVAAEPGVGAQRKQRSPASLEAMQDIRRESPTP